MDEMIITPTGSLTGEVVLPPSKSYAHRAILCAALSRGVCNVSPISMSEDMRATINAVTALGARCELKNDVLHINATDLFSPKQVSIDFLESGSTMRFLIPIIASQGISAHCIGQGRLPERTIEVFSELFSRHGAALSDTHLPVNISGKLQSGIYEMRGDISSQFITGMLLCLPLLDGDSEIHLTTHLESKGYIDITIACMKEFGVEVTPLDNGWKIKGNQQYAPRDMTVESDWSQAAFFFAAGAIGGSVSIPNLNMKSTQGDKAVLDVFRSLGADVTVNNSVLTVNKSDLKSITVDASDIPDMVPAIAVAAACAKGVTYITGAARLRIKESDRIQSVCEGLRAMSIEVREQPDGMIITGGAPVGGEVDCCNDHRIAMAFSVLAAYASSPTTLKGYSCVKKSYPDFYQVYSKLGGKANVIDR